MKTTIDAAGRLVIPKEILRAAGLRPGMPLDIGLRNGVVEITPAPVPIRLVRRARFLVAEPEQPVEPLTDEMVERTLEHLRAERARQR